MNYLYEELKHLPEAELRQEYTKLRDIAQKRLQRLSQDDMSATSQTYLNYKNRFRKLKDIESKSQLARSLAEVKNFIGLKSSTVTGQKAQIREDVKRFREKGYNFVNAGNIRQFYEYLEFNRSLKKGGAYDSERVLEMLNKAAEKKANVKLTERDFRWWMENYQNVKEAPDTSGDQGSGKWKTAKSNPFRG